MEFRSAIVDGLGCVMYWCDELQDEDDVIVLNQQMNQWIYLKTEGG